MKSFMNDAFEHIEAEVPCRGPLQALNHREPRAARTRWLCSRWCRVSWLGTPWPRAPRPSPGTPDPRGPSPSRREKKQRSFSGPLLTRKSDVLRRLQTPVSLFSMQYLERNKSCEYKFDFLPVCSCSMHAMMAACLLHRHAAYVREYNWCICCQCLVYLSICFSIPQFPCTFPSWLMGARS